MSIRQRIAFIGNSLPRQCGIATFTTDIQHAIASSNPNIETCIIAMNDKGRTYDYPLSVQCEIDEDDVSSYIDAAAFINAGQFDVVSLQHEFGIFGGPAGLHILELLTRLNVPVVTTLHSVMAEPTTEQRRVMKGIIAASSRLVVMAHKGRALLTSVYNVADEKIDVIAHGIPDYPFVEPMAAKTRLGFADHAVILTFGLLAPNKGIEFMIDAMPAILQAKPDALYMVLGATHPNLVHEKGEAYRESLIERARALGVENHVVFKNAFVDLPMLLEHISMCDVYVTPYLNQSQMTSGTLSYSFGLGKAVVSTPYWHAQELLDEGRGALVPFADAAALSEAIAGLLSHDSTRNAMRARAYAESRSMVWNRTALLYTSTFESAQNKHRLRLIRNAAGHERFEGTRPSTEIRLDHLLDMSDDTGLFQHAIFAIPDRAHGYCIDDNARALLLACVLDGEAGPSVSNQHISSYASFVQHAWNPDNGRFRNFMGFNRTWLEPQGSDDSHGRALWALGVCANSDPSSSRRTWARGLFHAALAFAEHSGSPRTWAFALLGLDAFSAQESSENADHNIIKRQLADRLIKRMEASSTRGWTWFESTLAYDNARLCQALIVTGAALQERSYTIAGMQTLRWLIDKQTAAAGHFRPVGSNSFGNAYQRPEHFDQQPLEATATIAACIAAWKIVNDPFWLATADLAFAWFHGKNDLSVALVDTATGGCRDGLHPDRVNENQGAESVLSYLLAVADMRKIARLRNNTDMPFLNVNKIDQNQLKLRTH